MQPTYQYNASVLRIHDGDTLTALVDLGMRVSLKTPLRFNGINAPELSTPEGHDSVIFLESLVNIGDQIVIKTYKNPEDKYGRWLADIYTTDGAFINQMMVDSGHAVSE